MYMYLRTYTRNIDFADAYVNHETPHMLMLLPYKHTYVYINIRNIYTYIHEYKYTYTYMLHKGIKWLVLGT